MPNTLKPCPVAILWVHGLLESHPPLLGLIAAQVEMRKQVWRGFGAPSRPGF